MLRPSGTQSVGSQKRLFLLGGCSSSPGGARGQVPQRSLLPAGAKARALLPVSPQGGLVMSKPGMASVRVCVCADASALGRGLRLPFRHLPTHLQRGKGRPWVALPLGWGMAFWPLRLVVPKCGAAPAAAPKVPKGEGSFCPSPTVAAAAAASPPRVASGREASRSPRAPGLSRAQGQKREVKAVPVSPIKQARFSFPTPFATFLVPVRSVV